MIPLVGRIPRPIRFLIIGSWNTVFSYVVFVGLHRLFAGGQGAAPPGVGWQAIALSYLAVGLSYAVAIPIAFLAYKFLVFETRGNYAVEFGRFLAANLMIPLVNLILYEPVVRLMPLDALVRLGVWATRPFGLQALVDRESVGQGLLQLFLAAVSYLLYRYYSFRSGPVV